MTPPPTKEQKEMAMKEFAAAEEAMGANNTDDCQTHLDKIIADMKKSWPVLVREKPIARHHKVRTRLTVAEDRRGWASSQWGPWPFILLVLRQKHLPVWRRQHVSRTP